MTAPTAETGPLTEQDLPISGREGVGLCLSGGGFRAALFHLGAVRRLHELGVLPRLRTISAVSGGSIFALLLAEVMIRGPLTDYDVQIAQPLRRLVTVNLRRLLVRERFNPINLILRHRLIVELMAKELEARVSALALSQLPVSPNFVFCATDLAFGASWVFERRRLGDYQAGYITDPQVLSRTPVALAAAVSACFPPVFAPLRMRLHLRYYAGWAGPKDPDWANCMADLRLNDGGTYDNMGTEPVWKSHESVLVSDGGMPFAHIPDPGWLKRILRYPDVVQSQARALRKRWLIASFQSRRENTLTPVLRGTYWGIGSARESYDDGDRAGYSKELARRVIARIRTDLDAFSQPEMAVLENHGYLMADIAVQRHTPELLPPSVPGLRVPHTAWMDEARVSKALGSS